MAPTTAAAPATAEATSKRNRAASPAPKAKAGAETQVENKGNSAITSNKDKPTASVEEKQRPWQKIAAAARAAAASILDTEATTRFGRFKAFLRLRFSIFIKVLVILIACAAGYKASISWGAWTVAAVVTASILICATCFLIHKKIAKHHQAVGDVAKKES